MEAVREAWTDERLDDLAARMDRGFERVDSDIRDLRSEMNGRFDSMEGRVGAMEGRLDSMEGRFGAIEGRLDSMEGRFADLQRTLVIGFAAMSGSVIASVFGAVLASQL